MIIKILLSHVADGLHCHCVQENASHVCEACVFTNTVGSIGMLKD